MSSNPSQVLDLNAQQTVLLKCAVGEKLRELDSFADDSLTEYVMVLLANRHPPAKIIAELEDFMNSMVVESFVTWLFAKCEELKAAPVKVAMKERRPTSRLLDAPNQRILSSALKGVAGEMSMSQNSRSMDIEGVENLDKSSEHATLREQRSNSTQGAHRVNRSRSPSPSNSRGRRGVERRAANRMDRSLSPPRRKSIRYESISARRERDREVTFDRAGEGQSYGLPPVRDARELLSSRRSARGAFDPLDVDRTLFPGRGGGRAEAKTQRIVKPFEEPRPEEERTLDADGGERMVRCSYWPSCKAGDACPYAHPTEPCKHFPTCMFGEKCIYIHPAIPCKFQDRCQNRYCNYQHSSPAIIMAAPKSQQPFSVANNPFQPPSAILCRFYPNCKNASCPFVHPTSTACKFGENCQRPACPYLHPEGRILKGKAFVNAPCRYGKACTKLDCPFQHTSSPPNSNLTSPNAEIMMTDAPAPPTQTTTFDGTTALAEFSTI